MRKWTWQENKKQKFFKKKSFNKQRGEKYKRKYYNKPSLQGTDSLEKLLIVQREKKTVSIGHAKK